MQRVVRASDKRIVDCAAVKVSDELELFVTKAFIVLEDGVIQSDELKLELLENLHHPVKSQGNTFQLKEYEIPRFIEFIDQLPRSRGCEKVD